MTEPIVNNSSRDSKPMVMVYPNGLDDSDQVYTRLLQTLQEANIECIIIAGQPTLPSQSRSPSKIMEPPPQEVPSIEFSIVVPIYNEEKNIPELYRRLTRVMAGLGESYEVIFVNDGSRDQSLKILKNLSTLDPNVRVINLARNFGHQRAICAGLDYSRGRAVIVMDGDLQDPPEVIPQFINKWREDFQVVYAIREKRKENFLKKFFYHAFYLILRSLSSIDIPLDAGDFCLMDRCVINVLTALPERDRFVRGLRSWVGFQQIGLAYEREARFAGKSKYTLKKLIGLALDGLISFSYLPLRLATILGLVVSVCSLLAAVYYVNMKLTIGLQPPGFATLTVLLLFLGGVQLVTVGIIGEYIGHILNEVKGRPTYVVQQVVEHQNIG